jgi:hypothetical protein
VFAGCPQAQSKWEDADVAWDILRRGPEPLRSQVRPGLPAEGQRPPLLQAPPVPAAWPALQLERPPAPGGPRCRHLRSESSLCITALRSDCCGGHGDRERAPLVQAPRHPSLPFSNVL